MTKISYIHGPAAPDAPKGKRRKDPVHNVPLDETRQRAAEVPGQGAYIPFNSLTKGEMHLSLMLQQAKILNDYYRQPQYAEAVTTLQNALYGGIHGVGKAYIGAADTSTMLSVARAINAARRETQPAVKSGIIARPGGLMNGVHVGEIIPLEERRAQCLASQYTTLGVDKASGQNKRVLQDIAAAHCQSIFEVEQILNSGLESSGLYLAYGYVPNSNRYPGIAVGKVKDQLIAQQELARVGGFSFDLLQQWLNVGMMRSNSTVAKLEPYDWVQTNSFLIGLSDAAAKEIQAILAKYVTLRKTLKMGGADMNTVNAQISKEISDVILKYRQPGIGQAADVATVIFNAIRGLIRFISQFADELRKKKTDALAAARGFGTPGFGPEDGDWTGGGQTNPPNGTTQTGSGSDLSTPLLIGGAAVAAYLLLD